MYYFDYCSTFILPVRIFKTCIYTVDKTKYYNLECLVINHETKASMCLVTFLPKVRTAKSELESKTVYQVQA